MAKKPEDKNQDQPQEEPQGLIFHFGPVGGGAIGEGALGEPGEIKPTSSGLRSVGTASYEVERYYRASLDFERSKAGNIDKTRQLLLGELLLPMEEINNSIAEYLPRFNLTELKVLSAIQRFIDEQYKPGVDGLEVIFSPQEFFSYCGLQKNSKGSYSGKQKEEYLKTLRDLASSTHKIIQQQSVYTPNKKGKPTLKYLTYRLITPILNLVEADFIESDTKEEAQEVLERALSGQELPQRKRTTRYKVRPEPIMYRLLDKLYVRKSISQYEEIRALHPGEKPKESTQAFLDFIQTLDISPLPIGRKTLAERMNLFTYIQQRKTTLINGRINEALEDALKTRYILRYQEEPTGLLKIYLNPERCSRYAEKLKRAEKEEA